MQIKLNELGIQMIYNIKLLLFDILQINRLPVLTQVFYDQISIFHDKLQADISHTVLTINHTYVKFIIHILHPGKLTNW